MYKVDYTNKFLKDLKQIKKRSAKDFSLVTTFIENELAVNGANELNKKYKAHKLSGNYKDNWECHIKGDLLIICYLCSPNINKYSSHNNIRNQLVFKVYYKWTLNFF